MNQKKTIALFVPSMRIGGAEKAFVKIANELINLGFQVDFITFLKETNLEIYLSPKVRLINFDKKNAYLSLLPLVRYLVKSKPHSLLSTLDLTNLIAILAKIISRQKTTVSIYIVNNTSAQIRTKFNKRFEQLLLCYFYPLADNIIANSYGVVDDLAKYINFPANKIKMQYIPTLDEDLVKLASEPISHPWFQENALPLILGIGRLVEQKDFNLLIESFAIVNQQITSNLLIIGEGEQYEMLQNNILKLGLKEHVELIGNIINPYPYVKKAALLAVPSKWDGLSMILIETMYLKIPVICTDCISGPKEALDNGKYGILVPVGNVNALSEGIIEILNGNHPVVDSSWMEQYSVEIGVPQLLRKMGLKDDNYE